MARIHFYKYQAAGNDFVLVDNRDRALSFSSAQISKLCDRRFGIGADGLIQLKNGGAHDFTMIYNNSDGSESFCGNGCRAAVHFANHLGIIKDSATFNAYDGTHTAQLLAPGIVKFSLRDVSTIEKKSEHDYYVNTGTDHNVRFVKNLKDFPVVEEGRKIRYSEMYKPRGTNANFVELMDGNRVSFRIYEGGVEDETYSSGSGATACALVSAHVHGLTSPVQLSAKGGELTVSFTRDSEKFTNIFLTGPAELVFETDWEI